MVKLKKVNKDGAEFKGFRNMGKLNASAKIS